MIGEMNCIFISINLFKSSTSFFKTHQRFYRTSTSRLPVASRIFTTDKRGNWSFRPLPLIFQCHFRMIESRTRRFKSALALLRQLRTYREILTRWVFVAQKISMSPACELIAISESQGLRANVASCYSCQCDAREGTPPRRRFLQN